MASVFQPPVSVDIHATRKAGDKSKYTVYVILVKWLDGKDAWSVARRFSEFAKLHETLTDVFQGLPPIPPKTWGFTQTMDLDFVTNRRVRLATYLKKLIRIEGVMNTVSIVEFLDIPKHKNLTQSAVPIEVSKISERQFGINQFVICSETGAVFTACEEVKLLNRFDAQLSNIRMPWEEQGCISPVGSFSCWKRGKKGLWQLVGTQFYDCPISCVAWDPSTRVLYSALQNGDIAGYRVIFGNVAGGAIDPAEEPSPEAKGEEGPATTQKRAFKLAFEAKMVHNGRITNLILDVARQALVSAGNDKIVQMTDVNTETSLSTVDTQSKIFALEYESEVQRCFVAGSDRSIKILDLTTDPATIVMTLSGHTSTVYSLKYFKKMRYLFSGGGDYSLGLWAIKNPRDVLMSDSIGFLKRGPPQYIRYIEYVAAHKLVITGHEKGYVAVWSSKTGQILMVFRAHRTVVTGLKWLGPSYMLMTSNHDCIRFWQFPPHMQLCRAKEADPDDTYEIRDLEEFLSRKTSTASASGVIKERKNSSFTGFKDDMDGNDDEDNEPLSSDTKIRSTSIHSSRGSSSSVAAPAPAPPAAAAAEPPRTSSSAIVEEEEEEVKPIGFLRPSRRYISKPEPEPEPEPEPKTIVDQVPQDKKKQTSEIEHDDDDAVEIVPSGEAEAEPEPEGESTVEEVKMPKKKVVEDEEEVDIFAAPKKGKKEATIQKFADLFGTGVDEDGAEQKKAMTNLFGDDDDDDNIFG